MTCSFHPSKQNNVPILLRQNLFIHTVWIFLFIKLHYSSLVNQVVFLNYPFNKITWKTVTVAQSRESKFFLSQTPVSGSQNLQPNKFIPRILKSNALFYFSKSKDNIFLYLKMKMNKAKSPKKTATLSIVFNMTISCLLRFGRNLTSFRILRSLKVLRTESPDPSAVTP